MNAHEVISEIENEDELNSLLHDPEDYKRQQKYRDIRRGIDDYFDRKSVKNLTDWYDYDYE